MTCVCGSTTFLNICGHCNDSFTMQYKDKKYIGYVPAILFPSSDDVEFDLCIKCGRLQGEFPISEEFILSLFEKD